MNEHGFSLGGEQSGHVIMSEYGTTGDGILTGLHLVSEMAHSGKSLAELDDDRLRAELLRLARRFLGLPT